MKTYVYLELLIQLALFLQRVQKTSAMDLTVIRNVQIGTVPRRLLHVMFRQEAVVSMDVQQAGVESTVDKVTNNNNQPVIYIYIGVCMRVCVRARIQMYLANGE